MSVLRAVACMLLAGGAVSLPGQDWASLAGTIVDPSDALVPGARLTVADQQRGSVKQATSNDRGLYVFDLLEPGDYTLEVVKEGFNKLRLERIRLSVRGRVSLRLRLELSPAQPTAVDAPTELEGLSSDLSAGTTLTRDYAENLPLASRNGSAMVLMAAGVVPVGRGPGEINVNGLRTNANYYTMDGVSLEVAAGTISLDSMQEVRVQTAAIAPEFGRSPGAQVALLSRAGGNQLHGSLSEYFQNDNLNANDWFANANRKPRPEMGQNRFGAALGGPVARDRSFLFASYDGGRQRDAGTTVTSVPSLATRASAPSALKPYLLAFPLPNGAALDGGAAQFTATSSNPSASDSASLRMDHRYRGGTSLFLRYAYNSSQGDSRSGEFSSPNVLTSRTARGHTATGSLVSFLSRATVNDLRLSFTTSTSRSSSVMDTLGGAVPLTGTQAFPGGITSANGSFQLSALGVGGYSFGGASRSRQRQINAVDSLTMVREGHQIKFGVDFRRSTPTLYNLPYSLGVTFQGLSDENHSLLSGTAVSAIVSSGIDAVYPSYVNFSVYGQDTYRATDRTTLTYGVRWDVNPAPGARKGPRPLALSDLAICQVTQNEGLYATRWSDIGPRLGVAYQLDTAPGREMMLRIAAGLFYDIGYGSTTNPFIGAPYMAVRTLTESVFPLPAVDLAPPSLPPARPYGLVSAAERALKSPLVYQWTASIDRWFGRTQSLSVAYVGTKSKRLLQVESSGGMRPPSAAADDDDTAANNGYEVLRLTTNGAYADYNGFQVQYRRMLSRTFQTQVSYALGHSIDTASSDLSFSPGFATLFGIEKGDSDYDVRHNLNVTGSYLLPAPKAAALSGLFGDWRVEWMLNARSALPIEIRGISGATSGNSDDEDNPTPGMFAQVRPSLVGAPIWIADPNVPGGRRLNPGAFALPDDFYQGNFARNLLRGFGMLQLDFSLRKQIALGDERRLQFMAQAFNVTNHPSFANPSALGNANTASAAFGVPTRTQGGSAGGFGAGRSGGARSLQFGLRLEF